MDDSYYLFETGTLTFVILDRHVDGHHYISIIDRSGSECVKLDHSAIAPDNEMGLSGLSFKSVCDTHGSMKRGTGTQTMIKAAVMFVMKTYPQYEMIGFKDSSSFDCVLDKETTVSVPTNVHNFVCYGETWYQRHFGAKMIEESDKQHAERSRARLSESFEHVPFDAFWNEFMRFTSLHTPLLNRVKQTAKTLYEGLQKQKQSWMRLFYELFTRQPDAEIYRVFGDAMPRILFLEMQNVLLRRFIMFDHTDMHMQLDRKTVEAYPEYSLWKIQKTSNPPYKRRVVYHNAFRDELNALGYISNNSNGMLDFPFINEGGARGAIGTRRRRVRKVGLSDIPTLACWLLGRRRIRRRMYGTRRMPNKLRNQTIF